MFGLLALVIVVFAFGLFSRRLEGTVITAPMVFAGVGLLLGVLTGSLRQFTSEAEVLLVLGEIALVLTLFTDATRINLAKLRGQAELPARLLVIGLPLTIAAGTVAAALMFTDLTLWEAAILGTLLAPTDAGLGHAVVSNPRVPLRIRQTLNVEAGLNDGISIPFLALFTALAVAEGVSGQGHWIGSAVRQIGFGVLVGVAVGLAGGRLVSWAIRRGWMSGVFQNLGLLAMALTAWIAAGLVGGNGFISAFVAGLATGITFRKGRTVVIEFTEAEGQLLNLAVFFLFGLVAAPRLAEVTWLIALYALLSLTLIRMLPVALSLIGAGLQRSTVLFLGWFGPRGLASIVLVLTVLEDINSLPGTSTVTLAVIVTVLLSVFAHGISAAPLTHIYGQEATALDETAPEMKEVVELPTRL
jgi:NhaP-type Na+/H+ or K+/H+ antiporter